jgi:hypothetical protein
MTQKKTERKEKNKKPKELGYNSHHPTRVRCSIIARAAGKVGGGAEAKRWN